MSEKEYSVSEAVRLIGVESHVLRYWEEELQIRIRRTSQGHRVYSQENIALFRRVKELKEKGIQLKAIRVLMEAASDTDSVLVQKVRAIERGGEGKKAEERSQGLSEEKQDPESDCQNETLSCEVIVEEKQENLRQFELILKRMIGEIVEEQNERLEKELEEMIREELAGLYLQIYRESAAAKEKKRGLGYLLKRYFGR